MRSSGTFKKGHKVTAEMKRKLSESQHYFQSTGLRISDTGWYKTLKNIGNRIDLLNRAETLQRNLETKEARAYAIENKPLKSMARQSATATL